MKKTIFQEKNLVGPEVVFNQLGNERFGTEWTNLPLKVLGTRRNTFKISNEKYDRKKFMARQVWSALSKFLKDPNVTIYADTASWDEDIDNSDVIEWKAPFRLSLCSDLLLIEKGTNKKGKLIKREFWIEMPRGKNPLAPRRAGRKPKLNKKYLSSILDDVAKLVKGNITFRSLEDAFKLYLKDKDVASPSRSWLADNLNAEVEKLKKFQDF